MSLISRLTTWAASQILTASNLNGEFNNVVNTLNNLDSASTRWTNVDATTYKKGGVTMLPILQYLQGTATTVTTTSGTSFAATSLAGSITPSTTSSKILIIATGFMSGDSSTIALASIFRGATNLAGVGKNLAEVKTNDGATTTMIYLDAPATTSSTTYTIEIASATGGATTTWGDSNNIQVIHVVELAF